MNAKLQAISDRAAVDLPAFIAEKEDDILRAWSQMEDEARDQEARPKFKLGFSIVLDLDANDMETALTWSVRQKVSRNGEIPDPSQPKLPMDEPPRVHSDDERETVRIVSGNLDTGEIPIKQFNKVAKKILAK